MSTTTHATLAAMSNEVDRLETKLLRENGWEHSSNYPDSCWRWSQKLPDGRTLALSQRDAISVQSFLKPDPEDEDERD